MSSMHNLDENLKEYFDFTVKGFVYRFQYLNTEEAEKLMNIKSEVELKKFLFGFISKTNDSDPDFEELSKTLIIPHWKKFKKMIWAELGD